ncbi:MAG: PilC/PilY family type IV pilus protein [Nitrospiria bacterium]
MKRNRLLFSIISIISFMLVLAAGASNQAEAQTLADYSALPPFLGAEIPPNVLLLVDNSGSMNHCAYANNGVDGCRYWWGSNLSNQYVSTQTYYGYFQEDKCYTYASNKFSPTASFHPTCANEWNGSFLNWLTMRRIDITKWVMTGGLCSSVRSSANSCKTIKGQDKFSPSACCQAFYKQFDLTGVAPAAYAGLRCIWIYNGNFYIRSGSSCTSSLDASFRIWVDGVVKQTGVIQDVGDKARFGLMTFDDDGDYHNGAEIRSDIGDNVVSLVNAIEGIVATSWTPLSEALFEASRYFAQITPYYEATDYKVGVNNDPYCLSNLIPPSTEIGCKTSTQGRWAPCCQSFVLMFTDGDPTNDLNIPSSIQDYAHVAASHGTSTHCAPAAGCTTPHGSTTHLNTHPAGYIHGTMNEHHDPCTGYFGGPSGASCYAKGSHYLDDVAYWAHTVDLRPPKGTPIAAIGETGSNDDLEGIQTLNFYPFFAFGQGSQLLKDAAKVGGFEDFDSIDTDGDGVFDTPDGLPGPDPKEWDEDGDGIADNYFESKNAFTLKTKLIDAISDILQKSASGTSISVLASSSGGEGAVYQAYFFPSKQASAGGDAAWLGYVQGLYFDAAGNLREDTVKDGALVLTEDYIVETAYNKSTLETIVKKYKPDPTTGKKMSSTPTSTGPLDSLQPLWEGGRVLAERNLSTDPRTIKTWIDKDADGVVDTGEFIDFSTATEPDLRPYLRATSAAEGKDIIDFTHGKVVSGYRDRNVDVASISRTWRLGDIIYSSPVSVGTPAERYDLKHKDSSFTYFYEKYKNRRNMVYVGANDGMLHAFNAGFFNEGDNPKTTSKEEHGYYTEDLLGNPLKTGGKELWAFIPQELLPHLKWLTGTNYNKDQHVYFVDGSPRVASLQIFTEEAACASSLMSAACVHPKGWGTVLIGSMRMGGGKISVTDPAFGMSPTREFRSAYFALDITDPLNPNLLWVFTEKDLGFTTSWPAITRYDKSTWYGVFGSGPLTYKGLRDPSSADNKFDASASDAGQLFTVNLKDGVLIDKRAVDVGGKTDKQAFMGHPVVYDMPKDYVTDVMYIGKNYPAASGKSWLGKVYRLLSFGSKDPTKWVLSEFIDVQKPVLVKPTATMDTAGRFWVYFGTGRFFSNGPNSDVTDLNPQGLYGLKESHPKGCWDSDLRKWKAGCASDIPAATLLNVTSVKVKTDRTITCSGCGVGTLDDLVNIVINGSSGSSSERGGWVIDLTNGERVLHESTVIGGLVAATTYVPSDNICKPQGENNVYALGYQSGSAVPAKDKKTGTVVGALGIESDGVTVKRDRNLGHGMASKVNVVVSKNTVTGFVQSSTGEIVQIKAVGLQNKVDQGTKIFIEKPE